MVITIASAVTAVGMKYAVMNHQMDEITKKLDKKQEYIDSLEDDLSDIKADVRVKDHQMKELLASLNRLHAKQSEKYEDE